LSFAVRTPSSAAVWAALLTVYIVWGSTYLAILFAVETMPPFLMASVRFLIAGGLMYGFRRLVGDPKPRPVEWRSAAVIGAFLLVGGNGGVVWAEQFVPSGIAALMVGSAPLWMVLIALIVPAARRQRQPPGGLAILGVIVGFGGITLLAGPSQLTGLSETIDPVGAAVLTLAAFLWASGSIYARGARLPDSPLLGTGMQMIAGGLGLLLLGTATGEWARLDLAAISTRSLLGLVYLIVFGSLVGFAAYTWLLRVAPTTLVSTYAYVNPLVAILLGSLLAQEAVTVRILVSAAIILSSVALITMKQPKPKKRKSKLPGFASLETDEA
jgi:drug/metabolite transporter (DMT)-like permease